MTTGLNVVNDYVLNKSCFLSQPQQDNEQPFDSWLVTWGC